MSRLTDPLEIGKGYDRKDLARLWNLAGYQAIGRGVFTPAGKAQVFLFVTRERLGWMTPYNNFLDGDLLFWEGEKGHGSDDRIANASRKGEEIHLFYRDHRPKSARKDAPSCQEPHANHALTRRRRPVALQGTLSRLTR